MTLAVYATVDDLTAWLGSSCTVPDNAAQLLRSATYVVARALNESPYNPDLIVDEARHDAVIAQVAAWIAAGITDPGAGGLNNTAVVKALGNDGATVDYDTSLASSVTAFQARQDIANKLAPEAWAILNAAGLIYVPVPQWTDVPAQGRYVSEIGHVMGPSGFRR